MVNNAPQQIDDNAVELSVSFRMVWESRWPSAVITALCAVGGVVYTLLATEWWRSAVVLVQTNSGSSAGGGLLS